MQSPEFKRRILQKERHNRREIEVQKVHDFSTHNSYPAVITHHVGKRSPRLGRLGT